MTIAWIAAFVVAAIVALTNLLKEFGVTGKWSMLASVVIGVYIAVGFVAFGGYPIPLDGNPYFWAVCAGTLLGLSACGLFDITKYLGKK